VSVKTYTLNDKDFYPTTKWVTYALYDILVDYYGYVPGSVIGESCCGDGAIVKAWPDKSASWICRDIRQTALPDMEVSDFLWDPIESYEKAKYLITNPSFSLAPDIVQRALDMEWLMVCMLLPLSWICVKKTRTFLRGTLPDLAILSERASFTPDGQTAHAEYAWFIWPVGPERFFNRMSGVVRHCKPKEKLLITYS